MLNEKILCSIFADNLAYRQEDCGVCPRAFGGVGGSGNSGSYSKAHHIHPPCPSREHEERRLYVKRRRILSSLNLLLFTSPAPEPDCYVRTNKQLSTNCIHLRLLQRFGKWVHSPRPTAPSLPLPICDRHLFALSPRYAASSGAFLLMIQFTLQLRASEQIP